MTARFRHDDDKGTDDLVIVPFQYGDLDEMMEIEVRVFTAPWTRQSYEDLAPLESIRIWVAKIAGSVAGYMLYQFWGDELELHSIAVKPEVMRRGIGSRLMGHMLAQASMLGITRIFLLVRPSNTAARALYDRFGFRTIGVRHRYYRDNNENAIVMCREVGA